MKNYAKKAIAALSAAVLGAIPMTGALTANAATTVVKDNVTFYFGDVNKDGKIGPEDASQVLQWATKNTSLSKDLKKRADVDGDGRVTTLDAEVILESYVTLLVENELLGDADSDGEVDINDAMAIEQYIRGKNKEINLIAADINCDGVINVSDYRAIARCDADYGMVDYASLQVRWGDVNSDGRVSISDYNKLVNYINEARVNLTYKERVRADVNCDGKITMADATAIYFYVMNDYFNWQ